MRLAVGFLGIKMWEKYLIMDCVMRRYEILINKKVITIADKDARIVGIYPGRESEICHIFYANTAILCSDDVFEWCSDLLARRWK